MRQLARIEPEYLPAVDEGRRKSHRTRTVYRVARVQAQEDKGLAYIRNVSDEGMKIELGIPIALGESVCVWLSDTVCLEGTVVWNKGNEYGLKFPEAIDSIAVLRATAEQFRSGEARQPRLKTELRAVVTSERGIRSARVHDVSQRGMKLAHDGSFTPGLAVKVVLESGLERRGFVRWVRDEFAGVMLKDMFSVQDLMTIDAL